MPIEFYLVAGLAVIVTGISKSGFAGGLGVISVPVMTLFCPPEMAVAILMPILLVIDVASIWRYRATWSGKVVAALLPGAAIGLGLGAISFQWMSADALKLAIGIMAIGLAVRFLTRSSDRQTATEPTRLGAFLVGSVSGYASFVAHAGGPPIKGYLLRHRLEKSNFVGTNSVFIFAMNLVKGFAYAGLGHYSVESLTISAMLAPCLLIGVWIGFRLHGRVDQRMFTRLAHILLAVAGVNLVASAAL